MALCHMQFLWPPPTYICRHGYFSSLPSREYVPLFWTDAELTGLQGTEIQDCATSDRQAPM